MYASIIPYSYKGKQMGFNVFQTTLNQICLAKLKIFYIQLRK